MGNLSKDKKLIIMITVIVAAAAVATTFAFVVLAASGNNGMQLIGGMEGIMMQDMMQMQAPEDVMILFESESQVPAGKQTQVVLKVLDKQTNATMQGAEVIIGIEKGLPMTTMDMIGGMFNAAEGGNGTYAFTFTPESKGYYTVHAHVVPPGEQMHSMMENHVDFVIISQ
jgi:FtsP/CotA-like multicopper oxidase with cupredoxin domain